MIGLLTSRADIEIFGKTYQKEDITPVEFEKQSDNISFNIKKSDFLYRLINKSKVFAINIPRFPFEKQSLICEINEGEFIDKFKLTKMTKIECDSIDCPGIDKSTIYECSLLKEEIKGDKIAIYGKILTTRQA